MRFASHRVRFDSERTKFAACGAAVLLLLFASSGMRRRADVALEQHLHTPVERAQMALDQMTEQEKLALVHGVIAAPWGGEPKPAGSIGSAGYVPGIPRLGIPALQETDAELGVANPGDVRPGDTATAMPSNLALASTWDPALARMQGQSVGAEARAKGFNVLLGGAANLIRDPRGGRNFEYFSEDPLLTGLMAGGMIEGVQSRHIISTIKHFALNAQETDRVVLNARIDPAATRESDLLAFEIAIERGRPGSVMCAYNQVNGSYSCENDWLLNEVLKKDWGYPYFVMSDWGAVHSTARSAMAGLDQESGEQLDTQNFFTDGLPKLSPMAKSLKARLDDMARRVLTSIFAHGLADKTERPAPVDFAASDRTALAIAREGIVLLKNQGLLPLPADTRRLLVIGAHADLGVPSGGGSSQVIPRGGIAAKEQSARTAPCCSTRDRRSTRSVFSFRAPAWTSTTGRFQRERRRLRPRRCSHPFRRSVHDRERRRAEPRSAGRTGPPHRGCRASQSPHSRRARDGRPGAHALARTDSRCSRSLVSRAEGRRGDCRNPLRRREPFRTPANHLSGQRGSTAPSEDPGRPERRALGPVGRGGHYGAMFTAAYDEGAAVGYKWFFERAEAAVVSVRLRAFVHELRFEQAGRERQWPHCHGQRDSPKFRRPGRRRDAAILSVRTGGRATF